MGPIYYILIALPCTIGAMTLAILHIYKHLLNYTEPIYQRYTVRIIFMVPGVCIDVFFVPGPKRKHNLLQFNQRNIRSLGHLQFPITLLSLGRWPRSCGGKPVRQSFEAKLVLNDMLLFSDSIGWIRFIRRCKQGCLQFVILKPILVVVTLILYAKGKYEDGNFNPLQSYLYLTIIYTISYSVALYALALFYVACRDLLDPFNPVPKFIIIKSVVFLTYWQVKYR
ncbi:hypothetical protein OROHE_025008 [Orobanche hederae]